MNKSKLVIDLNIKDAAELRRLTAGSKYQLREIAHSVIIEGSTYEKAGSAHNLTKHAVYEYLKRLYFRKYGLEYGKKKLNTKDTGTN